MLQAINKKYIVFGIFFYSLIAVIFPIDLKALFCLNWFTLIVYGMLVNYLIKKQDSYFTEKNTTFLVFYYTTFFVLCYNLISYYYTGNFYIFSEDDALLYHNEAETMSGMTFFKSIQYYLSRHEFEDLGLVIVLSLLYKFVVSKLLLSLFYVVVAILTSPKAFLVFQKDLCL